MDETMEVLKKNMELAGRRGENLDDLQDKTGRLADSAGEFRRGANKVRKDMWWKVSEPTPFCPANGG
jgi:vesicle-associated membrane protein 4